MNMTLVEIIADYAVLMEFSGEDEVSLETSTKALETIGWRLQGLTPSGQREFVELIRAVAARRSSTAEKEFLQNLPESAGLALDT